MRTAEQLFEAALTHIEDDANRAWASRQKAEWIAALEKIKNKDDAEVEKATAVYIMLEALRRLI
jgi:hypothetical protein